MDVYRKPTLTDRYLDFFSCHPLCHERSVVNTLLKRANNIPSTNKGRREETQTQRVKAVLRDKNYPMSFIRNCERALTKQLQWARLCSAAVCTGRFRGNRSYFETTLRSKWLTINNKPSTAFFRSPAKIETILTARNHA